MRVSAQKIKLSRCKKGYTQKELAKALGVTETCVTNWEQGVNGISLPMQQKLMALLKCEWEDLFVLMERQKRRTS